MRYYLSPSVVLKWLESPTVYNMESDELYELDEPAFAFLKRGGEGNGCEGDLADREFLTYALGEGILTERKGAGRRTPLRKAPLPSLRYLELQITAKCNLRCKHCYIGPPTDSELPLDTIERVCADFEDMQGIRLLITGGEPLLHSRFQEMNRFLPRYRFRKILFTNGLLLSADILDTLNVQEIQVSIDGLEEGHDVLRGKGTFGKTVDAVERALRAGFDVSVSTMVHALNLKDFNGMENLFRGLGITGWTVDVPCVEGNLRSHQLFQLDPGIAGKYLAYGFGEGLHAGKEGFGCGLHLAAVTADGKVAKCTFYKDTPAGTIDEGLEVCWKRISPVRIAELDCDCTAKTLCRGGCRYRAELLGNSRGKDFFRCVAFGVSSGNP